MIGTTISHYRILSTVGTGGMGVVYKAEDTRLHRLVAIKFLPQEVTSDDAAKARFIQEARAACALDHQHICTIYEIDETDDGRLFLVMAYYEGETLAQRIRRSPLPLNQSLELARQAAIGLASAHEAGIIHRDVKPANIMITRRGDVKILDFGLAKLTGEAALTQPGRVLGTANYMSPEQASGDELDPRTDIWSLGVVLFEMLTGDRPFKGPHPASILHAVLHEEAPQIRDLVPDLPLEVGQIVHRALTKRRALRYPSFREMIADLEAVLPGAGRTTVGSLPSLDSLPPTEPLVSVRSLLVLPFDNLSPDDQSDYFSDGLTDEIITDLSNVRSLRVISRTSANRLKNTSKEIAHIARELNVQYILEGSVRRAGDCLRITAKLIDARTDSPLWAEKYSGSLEDVFAIQETLSRKIVDALKVKLSLSEEQRIVERPISDFRTYEFYLKAKQEVYRYTQEALERAVEYLESGLQISGENTLLTAALGQVYWQFFNAGLTSDTSYLDRAEECAQKVLAAEPDSFDGYRLLGVVRIHRGQWQEGVELLRRAHKENPNDTDTLAFLGTCYGFMGKPEAGSMVVHRLLQLDPLTPFYQCWPGILAVMEGAFDLALEPLERCLRMDSSNPWLRCFYGQVLALNGRQEEAFSVWDDLSKEMPENFFADLGRCYRAALGGDRKALDEAAGEELSAAAAADPFYSWNLAECFALVGDTGTAVGWLEKGMERGFVNYPLLSRFDPFLENLRSDEGFLKLLEKIESLWRSLDF